MDLNIQYTPEMTRKERQIWEICQQLSKEGYRAEHITGLMIANRLEILGHKRGSNTDIYRFKKNWMMTVNPSFHPPHADSNESLRRLECRIEEEFKKFAHDSAEFNHFKKLFEQIRLKYISDIADLKATTLKLSENHEAVTEIGEKYQADKNEFLQIIAMLQKELAELQVQVVEIKAEREETNKLLSVVLSYFMDK